MEIHLSASVVLVLRFLFIISNTFSFGDGYNNAKVLCRIEEREALLSFKGGIIQDPLKRLSAWTGEECCAWEGIACHNISGHVLKFHLRSSSLEGDINSSLLELKHLQHLDLSQNGFGYIRFPEFSGSLDNLRYLDLSNACFGSPIPRQLGNQSRLHYLDVGSGSRNGGWCVKVSGSYSLNIKDLEWISGLTSLKFLDMSGLDLSKASNSLQVLNKLHSLSVLHLSSCELDTLDSFPHFNFSCLAALDLSCNNLISSKSDWVSDLSSLVALDLSSNRFHGPIPRGLANMTSLRFLDLSFNEFSSNIPVWLYHISTIERLDLSANKFQGMLPSGIENLTSLTYLDLSGNALEGEILLSLASLCSIQLLKWSNDKNGRSLKYLSLGWNNFSGHFPDQLGNCRSSFHLSISENSFYGSLPLSIGGLSSLNYLDIADNSLGGVVTEKHFSNLTKLEDLWASSNNLTLQVSSKWIPPFQLKSVFLGSWHLGPQFPAWLQTQKNLEYLDISNAGISDFIPNWFGELCTVKGIFSSIFSTINLSHNQLKGPLLQFPLCAFEVDLSNNLLSESLSSMLCRRIDGHNSLAKLDLSRNLFSGEIPDCWQNWKGLVVLNLADNKFTGALPASMGSLLYLSSLQLHNNYLSGTLPTLENCSSLTHMDLSDNRFSGSVPNWIGNNLSSLVVLTLHPNNFNGSIPLEICHLDSLQILDLGNNDLSGNMPRCLGKLSAMVRQPNSTDHFWFRRSSTSGTFIPITWLVVKRMRSEYKSTLGLLTGIDLSSNKLSGEIPGELTGLHNLIFLNLSENHLEGKIPVEIGSMKSLESLDLSMNKLSGAIPQSISSISFLSYLNLSFNNLSGKIPSGTQIQGFSPLSFIGNHELYGPPLVHNDEKAGAEAPTQDHTDEEDSGWINMKWFYASVPLGFAVGFWSVLGPLVFNKAWRHAYFRFVDNMIIHKILEWCM